MHAHESRRDGLPKPRNSEKRIPPALGRRHLLPAAARPRLRVRKRIRPMSKTAATRYTQGPTMTTGSGAAQPARLRDPDRQAPPTTVCPAQPLAELRPHPGLTWASVNCRVPDATFAYLLSAPKVETRETSISRSSLAIWQHGGQPAVKDAGCSSSGPGFSSQHPHSGLQPSVTSIPGDPKPSSDLLVRQARHVIHRYTYLRNIHTHKISV